MASTGPMPNWDSVDLHHFDIQQFVRDNRPSDPDYNPILHAAEIKGELIKRLKAQNRAADQRSHQQQAEAAARARRATFQVGGVNVAIPNAEIAGRGEVKPK